MSINATLCNYFNLGQCKSCTRIELPYKVQLENKLSTLEAALVAAKLIHPKISVGFQAQNSFNYRNRAKFVVAGTIEAPLLGMADNSQNVLDLPLCPLHAPEIVALAPILKETISKFLFAFPPISYICALFSEGLPMGKPRFSLYHNLNIYSFSVCKAKALYDFS